MGLWPVPDCTRSCRVWSRPGWQPRGPGCSSGRCARSWEGARQAGRGLAGSAGRCTSPCAQPCLLGGAVGSAGKSLNKYPGPHLVRCQLSHSVLREACVEAAARSWPVDMGWPESRQPGSLARPSAWRGRAPRALASGLPWVCGGKCWIHVRPRGHSGAAGLLPPCLSPLGWTLLYLPGRAAALSVHRPGPVLPARLVVTSPPKPH